jgi:hypothetical protein
VARPSDPDLADDLEVAAHRLIEHETARRIEQARRLDVAEGDFWVS